MFYQTSRALATSHLIGASVGFSAISLPMLGGKIWTTVKGEGKVHDLIPLATPGFRRQVAVGAAVFWVFTHGMYSLTKSMLKSPKDKEDSMRKHMVQDCAVQFAIQTLGLCSGIFAASYADTGKGGLYKIVKWGCGVSVLTLLAMYYKEKSQAPTVTYHTVEQSL